MESPIEKKFVWDAHSLEDLYTFMVLYRFVLLRMRNTSEKDVEKIKTRTLCSTISTPTHHPPNESCAVYEIMWKNRVKPDRRKMAI